MAAEKMSATNMVVFFGVDFDANMIHRTPKKQVRPQVVGQSVVAFFVSADVCASNTCASPSSSSSSSTSSTTTFTTTTTPDH